MNPRNRDQIMDRRRLPIPAARRQARRTDPEPRRSRETAWANSQPQIDYHAICDSIRSERT